MRTNLLSEAWLAHRYQELYRLVVGAPKAKWFLAHRRLDPRTMAEVLAAKEKREVPIWPSLPETRVSGSRLSGTACIGARSWISCTTRPGCEYAYDGTAVVSLVQRYYSSTFGRYMTSDPYRTSAAAYNPGTWNRYAYVEGDPVNGIDRTGLFKNAEDCINDPDSCEAEDAAAFGSTAGGSYGCISTANTALLAALIASAGGPAGSSNSNYCVNEIYAPILEAAATTCPNVTSASGTYYTCLHQSGADWKQFLSDVKDLVKALKKDTDCQKFLTSGGTTLDTIFADLSSPSAIFTLAKGILARDNSSKYGTTNDGVPGATPIVLLASLFYNSAALEGDITILHELAHLVGAIPNDPTAAQSDANDTLVQQQCAKALGLK